MLVFLLVLILVSLLYCAYLASEYKIALEEAQSRIQALEQKPDKFGKAVGAERKLAAQLSTRLEAIRQTESDLKNEIVLTATQAQEAKKRETELEMDMYKQEFKRNKQKKY